MRTLTIRQKVEKIEIGHNANTLIAEITLNEEQADDLLRVLFRQNRAWRKEVEQEAWEALAQLEKEF